MWEPAVWRQNEFGLLVADGPVSVEDARLATGQSDADDIRFYVLCFDAVMGWLRGASPRLSDLAAAAPADSVGVGCVLLMQHKIAVAYWCLPGK